MVFVKGGCFEMGDTFGDGAAGEEPVHEVCVNDFYIGRYAVTVGEFREFVEDSGYITEAEQCGGCSIWTTSYLDKHGGGTWRNPFFPQTERDPVVCVSWNDANSYLKWRSVKDGRTYRLPTEAEWEYAARNGGGQEKWAGTSNESEIGEYAWYDVNSDNRTHPVGQKRPNGLGLYDMSGNIWEWVADWYDEGYYGNSPHDNPKGPDSAEARVLRGGCWDDNLGLARAAARAGDGPEYYGNDSGFRYAYTE